MWPPPRLFRVVLVLLLGCSTDTPVQAGADYRIAVASGDRQLGNSRMPLPSPLVVRVENGQGEHVKGVRVKFSIDRATSKTAWLFDEIAVSDGDGFARAWLTLGEDGSGAPDDLAVDAAIAGAPWRRVRFTATTQGTTRLVSVTPGSAGPGDNLFVQGESIGGLVVRAHFGDIVVRVGTGGGFGGGVTAGGGTVSVTVPPCVQPGTVDFFLESDGRRSNSLPLTIRAGRAALALAPYEYITLPASRLADCISLGGNGTTYLIASQFASAGTADPVDWLVGADQSPVPLEMRSAPPTAKPLAAEVRREFEATLRRLEQSVAPEARLARAARASSRASLTLPPQEGSLRSFRVVSKTDGTQFTTVTARLRFVGNNLLVYTDTADRAFSDEQLLPMSSLFDKDLYGAAINAFGADPDIDGNGKLIALFTPVINRMSRAEDCVLRGFVTGFFYPVDQVERSANSNRAEIFYGFVPDPDGRHSCIHTEADVVRILQPTFIHELQHLISFNERVLARSGETEETWLNEGLSQIAEELGSRVFEVRYPAPLGRGTTKQIFNY